MNKFLDATVAQELAQYFMDDRYFNISLSQQSYTLGPTGNFSTDASGKALTYRPQRILRANLVLLSNTGPTGPVRIPIQVIPVEDYADIPVLNVQSLVTTRIYVQMTIPNVTLYCFPYPNVGNQFEFFMWPGFPRFTTSTSLFYGPPGYQDWFEAALARRLYPLLTKDVSLVRTRKMEELRMNEVDARRLVEGSNAPTPNLTPDLHTESPSGNGAPFSYLTGDFSQ